MFLESDGSVVVDYVILFYFVEFDVFYVFLVFDWLLCEGVYGIVIFLVFDFVFDYVV